MRSYFLLTLIQILTLSSAFAQIDSSKLCGQLDDLVNEAIPNSFKDISFVNGTITEIEDDKEYKRMDYSFINKEYVYFTEEGEINKKLLTYPLVTTDKEEAANYYVALKQAFDGCELVYTSFAQQASPSIGLIAAHTIGIDRRFYNSQMKLFQYESDSVTNFWIEYELIAPKLKE